MAEFKLDYQSLSKGLDSFQSKADAAIRMYAETQAQKMQSYSRQNAPWTDRTGMARKTLTGTVTRVVSGYKITLAHGVNYGLWLELANEKNYAIVQPTIALKSPEVMEGFNKLLERMGK